MTHQRTRYQACLDGGSGQWVWTVGLDSGSGRCRQLFVRGEAFFLSSRNFNLEGRQPVWWTEQAALSLPPPLMATQLYNLRYGLTSKMTVLIVCVFIYIYLYT